MARPYIFISGEYYSNCLVEALKAKIRDKSVKIYFCPPSGGQMFHFMWTSSEGGFDFSNEGDLPLYKTFWFKGAVRKFRPGFVERYSASRHHKKRGQ